MSKRRKEKKTYDMCLTHKDIYQGEMDCPICGRSISAFRVALFLKEGNARHNNFLPGKQCPICHR